MERKRLAGALLVAAVAVFIICNAAAMALYPAFNPGTEPFSYLGAVGGITSLVWSSGIFLIGLLVIAAGISYFSTKRMAIPYLLAGLGWMVNSLFNFKAFPIEHGLSAVVAFVFSAIIAISSFRMVKRPLGYLGLVCAAVILIATGLLVVAQGNVTGVFELLVIVPLFGWLLILGISILKSWTYKG